MCVFLKAILETYKAKTILCNNMLDNIISFIFVCLWVWKWLATGPWFFTGTPVSSTNKTDRHDITEILLKVTLNTTSLPTCVCLIFFGGGEGGWGEKKMTVYRYYFDKRIIENAPKIK